MVLDTVARHAKDLERIPCRPIDEPVFRAIMADKECVQEVLRCVLDDDGITVEESETQKVLTNLEGHEVTLDVACRLSDGRIVNIEAQHAHANDDPRRVRYHAGLYTAVATPKVSPMRYKPNQVPDIYIVYLMEYDIFGKNSSVYRVNKSIGEQGAPYDDGEHKVFVSDTDDGTPAAALMRILMQEDAYDYERFPIISTRKYHVLRTEKGRNEMASDLQSLIDEMVDEVVEEIVEERTAEARAKALVEGRAEGIAEGRAEGRAEGFAESTARLLREFGASFTDAADKLAEILGITHNQAAERIRLYWE